MRFVEILQGLPASGKTTYAKEKINENPHQYTRVNKDDLRAMMHNSHHSAKNNEKQVLRVESYIIEDALVNNKSVIVDSTNLSQSHINRIKAIVAKYPNVSCKVKYFDVSLEECIERNKNRKESVPEDVIRGMWGKYIFVREFYPTTKNEKIDLEKYLLVDMDGTLADCTHREHYVKPNTEIGSNKKNWDMFFNLTPLDPVRYDVLDLIQKKYKDIPKVIVTARAEEWRPHTEKWLKEKGIEFHQILMRNSNDRREDSIVKKEILDTYCDVSSVVAVIDDRPPVIEMWRQNGLHVEDVGGDRWGVKNAV